MRSYRVIGFVIMTWIGSWMTAWAGPCSVPSGSHPTIQAAVDDLACSEIGLQGQVYDEAIVIGRSLGISGVSSVTTIIVGQVRVEGGSSVVTMADLKVDASNAAAAGCFKDAVLADGGARLIGSNLAVLNAAGAACLLFSDGFEGGNTAAWSAVTP